MIMPVVVTVLLAAVGYIIFVVPSQAPPAPAFSPTESQSADRPTPIAIAAMAITAEELYRAYYLNEVNADQRYKGRVLDVTGAIDEIGKDFLDTPYVSMRGYSRSDHVQGLFPKAAASALSGLSREEHITMRCEVRGKILLNVVLKDCVLR